MRLIPLAGFFFLSLNIAFGVKPLDVSERNRVFPNKQFNKRTLPLEKNSRLQNQRFGKSEWSGEKMSPLGSQTAPIQMNGSFQKEIKEFPSFRRDDASITLDDRAWAFDDREARLENWNDRWEMDKARKFDVTPIKGGLLGLNEYFLLSDQISMQDINRYQFRRSHSREDGLKRTRVGSSE
ncbi:MAG: hypothetical protein AAF212_02590 [Verrucomicrobiota bacterium]